MKRSGKRRATARPERRARAYVLLVLLATALAFVNALGGELVYDDHAQIRNNPTLSSFSHLDDVFRGGVWEFAAESSGVGAGLYYRPLFNASLIVLYQLFGVEPAGWHAVSLGLHLVATALVFAIARRWGLSPEPAAAAALFFGLHPIHVESVAWASALPDPLAAPLVLSALLLDEAQRRRDRPSIRLAAATGGLALLAMLAKETALVLPLFVMWREVAGSSVPALASLGTRAYPAPGVARAGIAARLSPFVLAGAVALAMRRAALGFLFEVEPRSASVSIGEVLFTLPSTVLAYLRMLVVPYPLAVVYDHPYVRSPADPRFWAAAAALALLLWAAIEAARRSRPARLSIAFFALFLAPVLDLRVFNPQESLLHDRYLYLPSVGFCVLAAVALWRSAAHFTSSRRLLALATAAIAAMFFALTFTQNRTWHDDGKLAEHALRWAPASPFLLDHLGRYRAVEGDLEEARRLLVAAIEHAPDVGDYYLDLAGVATTQGRHDEAESLYRAAIERGSTGGLTYLNLGILHLKQGNAPAAEGALREALERQPGNAQAHAMLGLALERLGREVEAEGVYRKAVELGPAATEPRVRLGALHLKGGRCREAVAALEPLLRLASTDARSLTMLGMAYECTGDSNRARFAYHRAVEVAPDATSSAVARQHLAGLETVR